MPFLLAEILNFQGSTHRIGVGSFSELYNDSNLRQEYFYLFEMNKDDCPIIDLGEHGHLKMKHFFATLQGYCEWTPAPPYWFGWGGDLASFAGDVEQINVENKKLAAVKLLCQSKKVRGGEAVYANCPNHFFYEDFIADVDAIGRTATLYIEYDSVDRYICSYTELVELCEYLSKNEFVYDKCTAYFNLDTEKANNSDLYVTFSTTQEGLKEFETHMIRRAIIYEKWDFLDRILAFSHL